jgi:hypothetical protein
MLFIMNESIKREPKIRGIYECRCDERLQTKTNGYAARTAFLNVSYIFFSLSLKCLTAICEERDGLCSGGGGQMFANPMRGNQEWTMCSLCAKMHSLCTKRVDDIL